MLGFALLWASIAAIHTIRTVREYLSFSLTWWSFTFPVGTCMTGLSGLAAHTGLAAFQTMAVAGFIGLAAAWLLVAARTFIGSVIQGTLFLRVQPSPAKQEARESRFKGPVPASPSGRRWISAR